MNQPRDISLNGLEILVVEDDKASALLISRLLTRHGARVSAATDGRGALMQFERQRFPIVVTDICMPGMDGLELAGNLRSMDKDVQIIATSANRETDCLVTAIELGFSDYFLKPVEIDKLLMSIKRCSDVLEYKRQLAEEREKFKIVVDCMGESVCIKDLEYRILYQNRVMTELFGDRTGSPCYEIFGLEKPCDDCSTVQALADSRPCTYYRSLQHNGGTLHIESTVSPLRDLRGDVIGTVEVLRDVSERYATEEKFRNLAFHDPLTGLPNRRLFEDRLEQAIAGSRRYSKRFGLMTLDLDNFKEINDSMGHEAGDQLLREAAERLKSCCRRDLDTVSRYGGDEFCIILDDCGDAGQIAGIAQAILSRLGEPLLLNGKSLHITSSIGISIFPDNGHTKKELEIASDRAMYAAKKAGKNGYKFSEFKAV